MVSVPERLARLENKLENQDGLIERNYQEAKQSNASLKTLIEGLDAKVQSILALFEQAKGARWLAGTLLTIAGSLALVGAKTVVDWLLAR